MTTIRAAVHDAAGGVAANTLFHIVSREPLMRSSAAVVRPTSSDGRYEQAVGPGRYTLEAAGMRLGAGTASMPPSSCASADVEVNGQKTIDVDLVLRRCPTLSGRLIFDRAATPLPAIDITITVTPADPAPGSWVAVRTVRAQADRFEIPALPPGRYRLSAGPSQASPRPGEPAWYLATATLGERDVIDAPFDLRADAPVGEITATFNATPSTLKGRLMDASGRSVTGYAVILFSSDSSGWYWRSRRIQVVQTGDDGTFAVVGVPAGEYFLAAVTGLESDDEYDPEWLRRVTVSAIRVFLKAGQDLKQDLRLGPGSPRAPR
jgi:hypothetical protein